MKKQFKMLPILLILSFSIFNFANRALFPVVNATYVEGPITKDTVWTLVDSPFIVSKSITVDPNVTLTIEPGVEVKFGEDFSLTVSGKLIANGTDKAITFTSNTEQPKVGDWNSIIFNDTEKSTLVNCFVAYAKDGIFVENGDIEILSSTISFSRNGISAINGRLNIQDSTISGCSQSGINVTNSELTVQNSLIKENLGSGISIVGNGQATIQGNTIMANGNGILLTGSETSNVNISQNKISANTGSGIQINAESHSNIVILYNNISSNDEGFYISSPTSTYITNNSISYNYIGFLYDEGSHTANFNDIYGNEIGMDVLKDASVDAERNYWGHESGPYHISLNPDGKGNSVGGDGVNLDFIFFLTKPIGIINTRPTATLLADKVLVQPNEIVMFFATNSFDADGRIDKYIFNFGDGNSSGWTTLSIFTHEYFLNGTYYTNLTVMDDYGATSDTVNVAIDVQNFPPLQVNIELTSFEIREGEQVPISVHVTNGTVAVENATVTVFSVKGGNFTVSSGLTNTTGYFVTTFNAPDITQLANIRIVARASKAGYTDNADYKYLEVSPFLSVQVTANPDVIKSEGTAQIQIYVRSNEEPIENADVEVSVTAGSLSSETGITDINGVFSLVFEAPPTTTYLNVNITAIARKEHYISGAGQTIISVDPKSLTVQIYADSAVTISEAKQNVTVHVEYDMVPIEEANVTITAENGNFSSITELTDSYGDARFIFTAPAVNEQSSITITAQATKARYAEGQSQLEITVNPRTFLIQINAPSVDSGDLAEVMVNVTCKEDAKPVAMATVTVSSQEGNFSIVTKTTDATGVCTFVFNAPQTITELSVTITANVTKNGYLNGGNQTIITVNPKEAPPEGGWSITTILLILIPVVIVIVVVILIKLKVIVLSADEEESNVS